MSYKINIGDRIPTFRAKDYEGALITDHLLLSSPAVLYFYPKDNTPGCTKEACDFRNHMEAFDRSDVIVIGISPDGPEAHRKFAAKRKLNFTLLCDEKGELCRLFDVWREKTIFLRKMIGVERTTFVIDAEGIIRWIERPVKVFGHIKRVIEALKKHCGCQSL